jgi:integral membrane sensor domain MASE1
VVDVTVTVCVIDPLPNAVVCVMIVVCVMKMTYGIVTVWVETVKGVMTVCPIPDERFVTSPIMLFGYCRNMTLGNTKAAIENATTTTLLCRVSPVRPPR